jgi:alpha-tubulin suppressor-like RCC1 family protein
VILLENGVLFSWGNNARGNIGQNRSILETLDVYVDTPKSVDF